MDFETIILFSLRDLNFDNIDHELTEQEIKTRYRELALKFHPDKQIFTDDSWIKKINASKDFLIRNLSQVNAYLRRTNPQIEREETIRKKKLKKPKERRSKTKRGRRKST